VSGGEQLQIAVELALKIGVQRAHAQRGSQLDDAHRARRGNQRKIILLDGGIGFAHLLGARLDGQEPAGNCTARPAGDLDPLPAQRLEKLG
jgi:hypothetical protein